MKGVKARSKHYNYENASTDAALRIYFHFVNFCSIIETLIIIKKKFKNLI